MFKRHIITCLAIQMTFKFCVTSENYAALIVFGTAFEISENTFSCSQPLAVEPYPKPVALSVKKNQENRT